MKSSDARTLFTLSIYPAHGNLIAISPATSPRGIRHTRYDIASQFGKSMDGPDLARTDLSGSFDFTPKNVYDEEAP
jgi:hypothetical protein